MHKRHFLKTAAALAAADVARKAMDDTVLRAPLAGLLTVPGKLEGRQDCLISRLQAQAVPFEMMLYPGYTHRVGGPKVGVHLWETIFAFLKRHGVTPPE